MRIAFVVVMVVSSVAWANPPVAPKQAKPSKVEPRKAEPKPEAKIEAKLEHHVEAKKADAATSTLTLNAPRKKQARRVTLPDWTP